MCSDINTGIQSDRDPWDFLSQKSLLDTILWVQKRNLKTLLVVYSPSHYNLKGLIFGIVGPKLRLVWDARGLDADILAETLSLPVIDL